MTKSIITSLAIALTIALGIPPFAIGSNSESNLSGTLLIAGNGPERHLLVLLAQEFEKLHPSVSIDLFWHPNAKPIRTIQLDEADIGVTGEEVPGLRSTKIGRDGIAILTNFSNPIKELTKQQVANVFSGKVRFWSEIDEEAPEIKIVLINRANNQNIRQGFKKSLGITRILRTARLEDSESHAINAVTGTLEAITFVSMAPALRAKEDGISINLLFVDRIEPEYQTVLDGRYPLQRPLVFLSKLEPSELVLAFEQFVLSPAGQKFLKRVKYYPLGDE
jgi:phosphate transport system substrate-binding protein